MSLEKFATLFFSNLKQGDMYQSTQDYFESVLSKFINDNKIHCSDVEKQIFLKDLMDHSKKFSISVDEDSNITEIQLNLL